MNKYHAIMGYLNHKAQAHKSSGWEPTESSKPEFEEYLQSKGIDPQKTDVQAAFHKIVALRFERAAKWARSESEALKTLKA